MPKDLEKKRRLYDLIIKEVSLVDKPANMEPFMFVKNEDGTLEKAHTSIKIDSDGTFGGTKLTVNGRAVTNLVAANLSMFGALSDEFDSEPIFFRYTTANKGRQSGFKSTRTHTLTKANIEKQDIEDIEPADPEDLETITDFLKIDSEIIISNDKASTIAKQLKTMGAYREALPSDFDKALIELAKLAIESRELTIESKETEVQKEDKSVDIQAVIAEALKGLLPELTKTVVEAISVSETETPDATKPKSDTVNDKAESVVADTKSEPAPDKETESVATEPKTETKPAEQEKPDVKPVEAEAEEQEIEVSPEELGETISAAIQEGLTG